MAVTSLQLNFTEIGQALGTYLSVNRTRANWSSTMEADAVNIIRAGLRKFYYPQPLGPGQPAHQWSFLKPWFTTTTNIPYSTGTITGTNGAITGSGTAFPSTAADWWFIAGGAYYEVASYTNGISITLVDGVIDFAAGTSYELRRYRYSLPSDFVSIDGRLTYAADESEIFRSLEYRSEEFIRRLYQDGEKDTWAEEPMYYSIYPATPAATAIQSWYLILWPSPTAIYHLRGRYNIQMADLDATNLYPPGGAQHSQAILEAVLSEAELMLNDVPGPHTQRFMELLAASISLDRQISSPVTMGKLRPTRDSLGTTEFRGNENDYVIPAGMALSDFQA